MFGESRRVTGDRKAKDGEAPEGPQGKDSKNQNEKIDPELLKKKNFDSDFWRFKCTKPEGLQEMPIGEKDKATGMKHAWQGEKHSVRMGVRIYAWSLKSKKYTIDQLIESKMKWWKTRVKPKNSKEPKLDKKFKDIPMVKKGTKLELIGRSTRRERWIYIIIECKNDRMYQLEIYSMGDTSDRTWGKRIDQFIKSFKPQKK